LFERGAESHAGTAPSGPLVSAIVPCHDEVDQLSRALAGLAAQHGGAADLEVILVDNDSSDPGLTDVWERWREELELTLLRRPRLPAPMALCGARNLGMAIARGTWIWTLDSDSIAAPGYLAALRAAVSDLGPEEPGMFTGERIYIGSEGVPEADILADPTALDRAPRVLSASNYERPRDRRFPEIERLPDLPHPWDYMLGGNSVFRRVDALGVGGYDEGFDGHWGYEDDEFAHRMITRAGCVPRFVEGLEVYHQDPTSPPGWRRRAKEDNPNWHRVCRLIPGYREQKLERYAEHGIDVHA
jgi:glycosyltransferase involved in cell wall biosynthesis